jgi:hypothetical protein
MDQKSESMLTNRTSTGLDAMTGSCDDGLEAIEDF